MSRNRRSSFSAGMFRKNEDVLPFFSIHPKTKVGTIIRVALSVFCLVALLITFLAGRGFMFLWFQKMFFLVYIVPAFALLALLAVGLFKRMKTQFFKIAIPGLIVFIGITIGMSVASILSYTSALSLSPKMALQHENGTVILMRACEYPDGTEESVNANGAKVTSFPLRVDVSRYFVRVPEAEEGVSFEIEGEILIPTGNNVKFKINEEWPDEDTLHLYIAEDSTELATGEIYVRFKAGETTPASPEVTVDQLFKKDLKRGNHLVRLYSESSTMMTRVDSPLMMNENDFRQVYYAYPRTAYLFANLNTLSVGNIVVEPHGTLYGIQWEWLEKGKVARLTPAEGSVDAYGSITIYFDKKASDATPAEATPAEAAPVEPTPAEAENP